MPDIDLLSTCPAEEDQVNLIKGSDYLPAMRKQAKRYLDGLNKRFPDLGRGVKFFIKTNPHDFGDYLSVALQYPEDADRSKLTYVMSVADAANEIKTWEDLEADG